MGKTILVGSALPVKNSISKQIKKTKDEVKDQVKKETVLFKKISIEDLITVSNTNERVFIVGFNGGLVTKVFNTLQDVVKHHKFLNTDDLIGVGDFNDQMVECMKTLKKYRSGCIMAGVHMFRVLRRVESLGEETLRPNVVVMCGCENTNSSKMEKGLETMWNKYLSSVSSPIPLFFELCLED